MLLFAGLIGAATAHAQSYTYTVYVDANNSTATGCSVTTPGATLAGIESALTVTVAAGATPTVTSVTRSSCSGGALGAPVTEGTGAVTVGAGIGGTTSIELSDASINLAGPPPTALRLYVVAQSALGSDQLLTTTGSAGGAPILLALQAPRPAVGIPLFGIPALCLFCAILLALGSRAARQRMLKRVMLGLVLLSGMAGAAALFNWNGIAPLATDAAEDATSGESAIDLRDFFAASSNATLYFRIDVTGSLAGLPTVTAVSPNAGPTSGNTSVTITGTNFTGATAVAFGPTAATMFTVDNATTITATAPAGSGSVDIAVTTDSGTSAADSADQYTYAEVPDVTAVSPGSGPTSGGTSVTITGANFAGATAVNFGATAATTFSVNDAMTITATAPAGAAGAVDVSVTTPGGTSATGLADQYTFAAAPSVTAVSPNAGPTAGGTVVTITGMALTGATAVKFGLTAATTFTVVNATTITATAPAGAAGAVDVSVTTPGGTSATSAADQYTFAAAPAVTAVSPNSGAAAGGTMVTITGTAFTGATSVKFGLTAATTFTVVNATSISAPAPAGSGSVDIVVTTPGGISAPSAADQYAYVVPTVFLTVAGDAIQLNDTTSASTVKLIGADLAAYPAATHGTLAELVALGTASVIDSSNNFTLDASGNNHSTTFNFGTGAVSGSDPASSTGITYMGVTTYVTSVGADTVTLSAAAQNVMTVNDGETVNLGSLTYVGTLNLNAGAGGTDTINAAVGGNLSGATIAGTGGNAKIDLVLSAAGTETLSTAEYNTITSTTGGSITFTGGSFAANSIAFSNAGTVAAIPSVGNYDLSAPGNTITLGNPADNVTGAAGGNNTVNLGALSYTGTTAFGASGSNTIHVTVGGDISGGTITTGGAGVRLALSGTGSETLNTAQYNQFNANGITGGTAAGNTIRFSNAGTVTDNADVGNYDLSTAGNTITLTGVADNVTGAASGDNIVAIPQFSYAGTLAFGTSGIDIVQDPTNGDFSSLTVTSSGATLELMITGVANGVPSGSTTTTEVYNAFTTGPHAGGIVFPAGGDTNPADYIIAFSDQGAVTDSANVTNYYLNASVHSTINDIYTFNIAHNAAANVTEFSAATGGSTYDIDVSTFTGSLSVGSSGADTVNVAAGNDISGGQITSSGTAVDLSISGSGTVTVSSAEAALFHAAPSAIAAGGTDTMDIADATSPINLNAQENALTTVGLQAGSNTVNVSVGAASVSAGAAGFDQTIYENGAGGNTFNIDNGAATILGASDASHYLTINNFNTASDNIPLILSGVAQNNAEQDISDSGNDTVTVGNNGVIVLTDLGALPGFTLFNATDLAGAVANFLRAVNASTASTGEYTFVIDSNQGAAIYEVHVNSGNGSVDGIQLIALMPGVGAFNLVSHVD